MSETLIASRSGSERVIVSVLLTASTAVLFVSARVTGDEIEVKSATSCNAIRLSVTVVAFNASLNVSNNCPVFMFMENPTRFGSVKSWKTLSAWIPVVASIGTLLESCTAPIETERSVVLGVLPKLDELLTKLRTSEESLITRSDE